ncbi:MAG: hypothetical protein JJT76_06740 [Clostridiaceae bacterium]|nr:hypothetical protein [Clostridiaceae bacterium]
MLIEDQSYHLVMHHPREYQVIQETTTDMIGHYTLTITYGFHHNRWIIEDRQVDIHDR